MDAVREAWSEVLDRVKQESSALGSFLASSTVVGLRDDSVKVGFATRARFQKGQLDDPDRIRVVERVLSEVFGRPLRLDTVVAAALDEATAEEDPADPEEGGSRHLSRDEMQRIGREPIVNAIKELFMARLVNIERT